MDDRLAAFVEAWTRFDDICLRRPPKRADTSLPSRTVAAAVDRTAAQVVGRHQVSEFRRLCIEGRIRGWHHHRAATWAAQQLLAEETS